MKTLSAAGLDESDPEVLSAFIKYSWGDGDTDDGAPPRAGFLEALRSGQLLDGRYAAPQRQAESPRLSPTSSVSPDAGAGNNAAPAPITAGSAAGLDATSILTDQSRGVEADATPAPPGIEAAGNTMPVASLAQPSADAGSAPADQPARNQGTRPTSPMPNSRQSIRTASPDVAQPAARGTTQQQAAPLRARQIDPKTLRLYKKMLENLNRGSETVRKNHEQVRTAYQQVRQHPIPLQGLIFGTLSAMAEDDLSLDEQPDINPLKFYIGRSQPLDINQARWLEAQNQQSLQHRRLAHALWTEIQGLKQLKPDDLKVALGFWDWVQPGQINLPSTAVR